MDRSSFGSLVIQGIGADGAYRLSGRLRLVSRTGLALALFVLKIFTGCRGLTFTLGGFTFFTGLFGEESSFRLSFASLWF